MSALFEFWRKQHSHDTELDWLFYSGREGVRSRPPLHLWDMYRTTTKTGMPYAQSLKSQRKPKGPYDLSNTREIGHLTPSVV